MGQGDNQVLVLKYNEQPGASVKDQHNNLLRNMSLLLSTIGPPLKTEETWSSSTFFTYGKFPILNGVLLSMSLKRLCRMFRFTFSAAGEVCPPIIIYPFIRMPSKIPMTVPLDWGVDNNEMTSDIMYEYISNTFNNFLVAENVKRPVILFLDGQLSMLCNRLEII